MSALTAGNWIAFQNESQVQYGHWSVGIENQYGIHGVGSGELRDVSMEVGGICTEADAKAMAASKEMLAALQLWITYDQDADPEAVDFMLAYERALTATRAALAKAGAQ